MMDTLSFLNWCLVLLIFEISMRPSSTTTDDSIFKIDTRFNGLIAPSGFIEQWTMSRTSRLECASSCLQLTDCVSFFIQLTSSLCQFHSTVFQDTVSMTSSISTVYYRILSNTSESCGTPVAPSYGNFTLTNGTLIGSIAVLTCDAGYLPLDTAITCKENGWTNLSTAICQADSCSVPTAPSHGYFTLANGTTINSIATLTCDAGYLPFETTIVCTGNGWTNLSTAVCRDCPSGWSKYGNTCYYLGHTEVNNYVALSICDSYDSDIYSSSLIKFDTVPEREYVRGLMKAATPQPSYGFWIGLYQLNDTNGSEAWLPSGRPLDPAVIDWFTATNSPEPNENYQRCSSAYKSFDYQWTDIECANDFNGDSDGRLLFVLCEIDL